MNTKVTPSNSIELYNNWFGYVFIFLCTIFTSNVYAQNSSAYTFTTVGSASVNGNGYADGTASNAIFSNPTGIAVDANGNIYIADSGNNVIRELSVNKTVTTIAGQVGVSGSKDGNGLNAQFGQLTGLTIDSSGNLYVLDSYFNTVRKIINNNGIWQVTTLVPSSAGLNNPTGIAADTLGNLWVADSGNYVIRKITLNGNLTTFAGTLGIVGGADGTATKASFAFPVGIALDSSNNIYVTDYSASTLRKISSNGTVTTMGGFIGSPGYLDGPLNNNASQFNHPSAIVVDNSGNLYISDGDKGSLIRTISTGGVVSTIGGSTSQGSNDGTGIVSSFSNISGLAIDKTGVLFISNTGSATIRKGTPPLLNTTPKISNFSGDVLGIVGYPTSLQVSVTGTTPITFNWYCNGSLLTNSNVTSTALTSNLNLPKIELSQIGQYYVTATNTYGTVTSTIANILLPATITTQPLSAAVMINSSVSFNITATGNNLSYQWNFNNIPIPGANSQSYSIPSASITNLGSYTVTVSNTVSTTTSQSAILSFTAPVIINQPSSISATLGANASFLVTATGASLTYQWYFNGLVISGANSATYTVNSVSTANSGVYTCKITNTYSSATSAPATLTVSSAIPIILIQPKPLTLSIGSVATFSVTANNNGPLQYQWQKNGVNIINANSSTYTIQNTLLSDVGIYSVVVSNSAGSTISSYIPLNAAANGLPLITESPNSQTITSGSSVVFKTTATSAAAVAYQWCLNGIPIVGASSSTLLIQSANLSNVGTYNCLAINIAGTSVSASANLSIQVSANPGRLVNLSVLTMDGPGSQMLTLGFVNGGAGTLGNEPLLIRASGPALTTFGIDNVLADPTLKVLQGNTIVVDNDNWGSTNANIIAISAANSSTGAFPITPTTSLDAAVVQTLPGVSGGYTVQVAGNGTGLGIALAEIYDYTTNYTVASPRLINLSCMQRVAANGLLSAGFAISGDTAKTILIRASGPTLGSYGIQGTMPDPQINVFSGSTLLAHNSEWAGDTSITVSNNLTGAFQFSNKSSKDSAVILTLGAGSYTVQSTSVSGTAGVTMIEVYEVP